MMYRTCQNRCEKVKYHYMKNKLHTLVTLHNKYLLTRKDEFIKSDHTISVFVHFLLGTMKIMHFSSDIKYAYFFLFTKMFTCILNHSRGFNNLSLYMCHVQWRTWKSCLLIQAPRCLKWVLKCPYLTRLYWSHSKLLFVAYQLHIQLRLQDYESEKYDMDYNL